MNYNSGTFCTFCCKDLALTSQTVKKETFGNKFSFSESLWQTLKRGLLFLFYLETLEAIDIKAENPDGTASKGISDALDLELDNLPGALCSFYICHTTLCVKKVSIIHKSEFFKVWSRRRLVESWKGWLKIMEPPPLACASEIQERGLWVFSVLSSLIT